MNYWNLSSKYDKFEKTIIWNLANLGHFFAYKILCIIEIIFQVKIWQNFASKKKSAFLYGDFNLTISCFECVKQWTTTSQPTLLLFLLYLGNQCPLIDILCLYCGMALSPLYTRRQPKVSNRTLLLVQSLKLVPNAIQ
jgi:hypothetical protein